MPEEENLVAKGYDLLGSLEKMTDIGIELKHTTLLMLAQQHAETIVEMLEIIEKIAKKTP